MPHTVSPPPTRDDTMLHLETLTQGYIEARDELAKWTLALIVTDVMADAPSATAMHCETTDQDFSGSLTFSHLADASDLIVDLPDEGDRFYDYVPLDNLRDDTAHVWQPFCSSQPIRKHESNFVLDLVRIKAAYDDGTLFG